ncbi:hypothetical protein [Scytonema hofmannii]|uniref:hypothetical protein n=1 Tax=Scytonema hofmannii TaxID=34078 RepID=UPI0011E063F5|nr:hypothetical protein [Scytonema hofmannii]
MALLVERTYTVELGLYRFIYLWVALSKLLEAVKWLITSCRMGILARPKYNGGRNAYPIKS